MRSLLFLIVLILCSGISYGQRQKQIQGIFAGTFRIPPGKASAVGKAFCQDVRGLAPDYMDTSYDVILSSLDLVRVLVDGVDIGNLKTAMDGNYVDVVFNGHDVVYFNRGEASGDKSIEINVKDILSMSNYQPDRKPKWGIDWSRYGQENDFSLSDFQVSLWRHEIKKDFFGMKEPFKLNPQTEIKTITAREFWEHYQKVKKPNDYECTFSSEICIQSSDIPVVSVGIDCDGLGFTLSTKGEMTFTSEIPGRFIKRSVSSTISFDDDSKSEAGECGFEICLGTDGVFANSDECFVDVAFGNEISVSYEHAGVTRTISLF